MIEPINVGFVQLLGQINATTYKRHMTTDATTKDLNISDLNITQTPGNCSERPGQKKYSPEQEVVKMIFAMDWVQGTQATHYTIFDDSQ